MKNSTYSLKPLFDAGATVAEVLPGLDLRPRDKRCTCTWSSTAEIRHVPGWVRYGRPAWSG